MVGFPATEEGIPNLATFGKDELFVARALKNYGDSSSSFLYQKTNGYNAVGGHSMGGGASFLVMNGVSDVTTFFNFSGAETFALYGMVATEAEKHVPVPLWYLPVQKIVLLRLWETVKRCIRIWHPNINSLPI